MIGMLALRNLTLRPWRSALLLFGFGLGVGVMIVLLSIGEALLTQARDERLVGGGDVTVLPEGIDVEVMKTGGVGGLFFSISNARFLYLQLLSSPRNARAVRAVAPQIDDKLLYLRTLDGRERAVRATGELPSRSAPLARCRRWPSVQWSDDELRSPLASPTLPSCAPTSTTFIFRRATSANRDSWAEWHYFNVLSADRKRWAFISFIVGGAVPDGRWGGQVLLTLHEEGRPARRFRCVPDGLGRVLDVERRPAHRQRSCDGRFGRPLCRSTRVRVASVARATRSSISSLRRRRARTFPARRSAAARFVSGYAVAGLARRRDRDDLRARRRASGTMARRRTTITTGACGAA